MAYSLKWLKVPSKTTLTVSGVILIGIALRTLHLHGNHYPVLGTDSYYFHYLVKSILAGETVPVEHSGIVYVITGIGQLSSLSIAVITTPLILFTIGSAVLYLLVKHIFGNSVGIGALVSYAVMPMSVLITAAGFLDRDGGTVILFTIGGLGWYILRNKPVLAVLLLLVSTEVITYYWAGMGRWVYLALMAGIIGALMVSGNRKALLISGFGIILSSGIGIATQAHKAIPIATDTVAGSLSGSGGILEMTPATPTHLLVFFSFCLLTCILGAGIAAHRRQPEHIMILVWFAGVIIVGCAIQRAVILAIPAVCVLSGIGMAEVWRIVSEICRDSSQIRFRVAVGVLMVFMAGSLIWQAATLGSIDRMAPDMDWQRALRYLKTETPEESRILSHWGNGYWILDLTERHAIARGGPRLQEEMDTICETDDPDVIDEIMQDCQADYLILDLNRVTGRGIIQVGYTFKSNNIAIME